MSVAKIVELSSSSPVSFHDAIEKGIARASKTIKGITGAWVQDQKLVVEDGNITSWRVNLKVSFVLDD